MTLFDLINLFRIEAKDQALPPLFPNDEITLWLNEAEEEAAIRARLIRDNVTSEICEIDVQANERSYPLDPRVFEIVYASMVYVGSPGMFPYVLGKTTADELDSFRPAWRILHYRPTAIIQYDTTIEVDSLPDTDYTINLEVYRLPLKPMEDDEDEPEINSIHHRKLVWWALKRGYEKPEAEIYDLNKSARAEEEFKSYFGDRPNADLRKKQNANRPHHNQAYW